MTAILSVSRGLRATRDAVAAVPTPEGTDSWRPIAHHELVEQVVDRFVGLGYRVDREQHGLWRDGARYFGVFDLAGPQFEGKAYTLSIGLRNSHDQSLSAGILVGSRVFICDNGAFSAEVSIFRKHTAGLHDDLPRVIARAVANVEAEQVRQDRRFDAYRESVLSDVRAHDLVIRAVDRGVIPPRLLPRVLKEYRRPTHAEFSDRNVWSLFNAFTQVLKDSSPVKLPDRTMKLHAICDEAARVAHLN